jgi:hypothetical protein
MTCSCPGEDTWTASGKTPVGGPGLVAGHAYTLLQAVVTSSKDKLLEIRNPWGRYS